MKPDDLRSLAIQAVNLHGAKSTMPMLYEDSIETRVCGTATLFQNDGKCFLLTADHVANLLHNNAIGIPASPLKSEIWRIGTATRITCRFDVAVVLLRDQDLIGLLPQRGAPDQIGPAVPCPPVTLGRRARESSTRATCGTAGPRRSGTS